VKGSEKAEKKMGYVSVSHHLLKPSRSRNSEGCGGGIITGTSLPKVGIKKNHGKKNLASEKTGFDRQKRGKHHIHTVNLKKLKTPYLKWGHNRGLEGGERKGTRTPKKDLKGEIMHLSAKGGNSGGV